LPDSFIRPRVKVSRAARIFIACQSIEYHRIPSSSAWRRPPIPAITSIEIERYMAQKRREGRAPKSISNDLARACVTFAEQSHWGKAMREYMRDYNHWAVVGALSELLPLPGNRVTLAEEQDAFGMPIARFDYTQCENDRANIANTKRIQTEILEAAGVSDLLTIDRYAHLVGGCRMGTSPQNSVIDADHRVWGVPNLFVCDGSVMPTQGSANPALTIMALASRLGQRLAAKRVGSRCG